MNTNSNPNLYQQCYMHALRLTMGLPLHRPTNDAVAYCIGKPMDLIGGSEMARLSRDLQMDIVHIGFADRHAIAPSRLSVVYRELEHIDVIDHLDVYAAAADKPVLLISDRRNEHFCIDQRGGLARLPGNPTNLVAGRKLARRLIQKAAQRLAKSSTVDCQIMEVKAATSAPAYSKAPLVCFV
jgi:hypothetical protein